MTSPIVHVDVDTDKVEKVAPMMVIAATGAPCLVYSLEAFKFGEKPYRANPSGSKVDKEREEPRARLERLDRQFRIEGLRRVVEGICVVQNHGHAHVLLLKSASRGFSLPGGRLRPGEDELRGLCRKLNTKLGLAKRRESGLGSGTSTSECEDNGVDGTMEWEIGEHVATWWRPCSHLPLEFPYVPPHMNTPRQIRKQYLVHLPPKCSFAVPSNLKLLAVPLFDLYQNVERYGSLYAALPQVLSRIPFVMRQASIVESQVKINAADRDRRQQEDA